jgi:RNA polymerase sigma-54 factor
MQSRQSLELRQHQQLALTPQLQQSLRFLQLSTHELEQEVSQALTENPMLEREEEYDTDAGPLAIDDAPDREEQWPVLGLVNRNNDVGDDDGYPERVGAQSLHDYLLEQLRLTQAMPRDVALVELLIGELDDNGYMTSTLDEIAATLPPELDIDPDELRTALRLLQSFDPAGVGASSLSDCLALQLRHREAELGLTPEVLKCALDIVRDHLPLLATGNLRRLAAELVCEQDVLHIAHGVLLRLDPRPGRHWGGAQADYVVPDVVVRKVKDKWHVALNPATIPKLRINAVYQALLERSAPAPGMHQQMQQAQGLIKSMNLRFITVLRVAEAIVARQAAFLEHGVQAMQPLVLRDIAEELEMHESTVSRATKQKYAQTPWGVIEMKRFFATGLQTETGQSTTATAVQSLITAMVAAESPLKPLSDSQIASRLAETGVTVARRTVAKYREAAGIEAAALRKARAASV